LVLGGGAWKGWLYVEIWRGARVEKEEGVVDALHTMHVGVVALWWECGKRVESVQACADYYLGDVGGVVSRFTAPLLKRGRGGVRVVSPLYMEFNDVWHRG